MLWLGIFHYAFLGVLRPHRTGDRDLVDRARADARRREDRASRACGSISPSRSRSVAMLSLILFRHCEVIDWCAAISSNALAVALIGGSLFFFKETLDYLARRDYVAALLVMVIGVAVISVGKEMARLALVQRD